MSQWTRWACALALALGSTIAFAGVTGMKFVSSRGDYIGEGKTGAYVPPTATITAQATTHQVSVHVSDASTDWNLTFAAPTGATLVPGSYPNAARFSRPFGAGVSVISGSRACNMVKGWLNVLEYQLDDSGNVKHLAIDFVQNCEVTGPPLYGSVRINSRHPLRVPAMAAVAGADFGANSGTTASLDGTQSFSRRGGRLSYKWTQIAGPAVSLNNPTSATPDFAAPAIDQDSVNLQFQLEINNGTGQPMTDDVVVIVIGPGAARTEVSFHGDPGDYITNGNSYGFNAYNAAIVFSRNYDGGISAAITGLTWWNFDSAVPQGMPYVPSAYPNAQRFPFQSANAPGLSLAGMGAVCNTVTGNFTVYQAQFDLAGNPQVAEIEFEQHCDGVAPAAYGKLLLNAVPHDQLVNWLRATRRQLPRRQAP